MKQCNVSKCISYKKKTYSTSRFSSDENTLFAKFPMLLEDKSLQKMNQDQLIFLSYIWKRYFSFHFFNIEAKWKEKSRSKGLISQQGTELGTSCTEGLYCFRIYQVTISQTLSQLHTVKFTIICCSLSGNQYATIPPFHQKQT